MAASPPIAATTNVKRSVSIVPRPAFNLRVVVVTKCTVEARSIIFARVIEADKEEPCWCAGGWYSHFGWELAGLLAAGLFCAATLKKKCTKFVGRFIYGTASNRPKWSQESIPIFVGRKNIKR